MYTTNNQRNEVVREATNCIPGQKVSKDDLRQVSEIPEKYRTIFESFSSFNLMQSAVIDFVLQNDTSVVISAPTGSGKTVVFELAIIRLMEKFKSVDPTNETHKIVYMAPVKALCTERFSDWSQKLRPLGLRVIEITGDSNESDLISIKNYDLILTTPEKWDSMTRKWTDHRAIVQVIKLFLIDEVHLLNEERRGATLEAVVSRMKTVHETELVNQAGPKDSVRFVAVSAVINNIEDVSRWLGTERSSAKFYKFDEAIRPIKIRKIVIGYPEDKSSFKFEMNLAYRLKAVLNDFSEGKPTLIFCSTRKSTQQTATVLSKTIGFEFTGEQLEKLNEVERYLLDNTLKNLLKTGMGYHHAGMAQSDRNHIEELFRSGYLPVLVATSTLAMGVNLPAHLVIIKSTEHYVDGSYQEYSEAQILQMMGRAGRPQYGLTATAVIMTQQSKKAKYEKLASGQDLVESCLHNYLVEHLNAEVVLRTVTDIAVAMKWLRSTFLYVRACKNPRYYGLPGGLGEKEIEHKLLEMCMRELNGLKKYELIEMSDSAYNVRPTENGKLMARYYIAFETMKIFMTIKGTEQLPELLDKICLCHEFQSVKLRWSEKSVLNSLNLHKERQTIRFHKKGKIKTKEAKINYLIQASLGGIQIPDASLVQEAVRIMRILQRLTSGLVHFLWQQSHYQATESALVLKKCVHAQMWENSPHVTRQLPGIGPALAVLLANSNKTSFRDIVESNPRDLERIINRPPPMGNQLQEAALRKPQYELDISFDPGSCLAKITLKLKNGDDMKCCNSLHSSCLLVAGSNVLLKKYKISDRTLVSSGGVFSFQVRTNKDVEVLIAAVISDSIVGVDVKSSYKISEQRFSTSSLVYKVEKADRTTNLKSNTTKAKPQSSLSAFSNSPKTHLTDYLCKVSKKLSLKRPDPPATATSDTSSVGEVTSTQDFIPPAPKSRYSLKYVEDVNPSEDEIINEEDSLWLNNYSDDEKEATGPKESTHSGGMAPDSCQDNLLRLKYRPLLLSPGGTASFNSELQESQISMSSFIADNEPYVAKRSLPVGIAPPTVHEKNEDEVNENPINPERLKTNSIHQVPPITKRPIKSPSEQTTSTVFQVPDDQFLHDINSLDLDLGWTEWNEPKGPTSPTAISTVDGLELNGRSLIGCDDVKEQAGDENGFSIDELLNDSPTFDKSPICTYSPEEINQKAVPVIDNAPENKGFSENYVEHTHTIKKSDDNSRESLSLEENSAGTSLKITPPADECGQLLIDGQFLPAPISQLQPNSRNHEMDVDRPEPSFYARSDSGKTWNENYHCQPLENREFYNDNFGQVGMSNQRYHSYENTDHQNEQRRSNYGSVLDDRRCSSRQTIQPTGCHGSRDFFVPENVIDYNYKSAQRDVRPVENLEVDSSCLFYRRKGSSSAEHLNSNVRRIPRDPLEMYSRTREPYPETGVQTRRQHLEPEVLTPSMPFENVSVDYYTRYRPYSTQTRLPATRYPQDPEPTRSLRSEYGDPYENIYTSTMKKLVEPKPSTMKPVNSSRVHNLNSLLCDEYKSTFPIKFESKASSSRSKIDSQFAFKVVHDPTSEVSGRFHPYRSVGLETKRAPELEFSEGHTRLPPKPVQLTKKERLNRGVQKFQDDNGDSRNRLGGGSCDRLSNLLRDFNNEGLQRADDRFRGASGGANVAVGRSVRGTNNLNCELFFDANEQQTSMDSFPFLNTQAVLHGSSLPTRFDDLDNPQGHPNLWNNNEQEKYNLGNDRWDEAPSNNNNSSASFFLV